MADLDTTVDVEQLLIDALRAGLAECGYSMPVGSRVPNPSTTESVQVYRTGGNARVARVLDGAQVTIDVRAAREVRAVRIMGAIAGLMHYFESRVLASTPIYAVDELSSMVNLPDPLTPNAVRYTQTFVVTLRTGLLSVPALPA